MRIAVIGAGFLGACVAYHAARSGADVVVLEADQPCAGASGASFACLNVFGHSPAAFVAFRVAAISALDALAIEIGAGGLVHRTGTLRWAADARGADALRERAAVVADCGAPCGLLDARWVKREIEPALDLSGAVEPIILLPFEGWIDLAPFTRRLLDAAHVSVVPYARVTAAVPPVAGRTRLVTSAGNFAVDRVIIAAGIDTPALGVLFGAVIPVDRRPGVLTRIGRTRTGLRHVIYAPGLHVRPDGGDDLLGGIGDQAAQAPCSAAEIAARAERTFDRAMTWVPAVQGGSLTAIVGVRPMPPGGYPIAGPLPARPDVYALVSHGGATLGALLGRLVAEEIVTGIRNDQLKPYRLDRGEAPSSAALAVNGREIAAVLP